MAFFKLLFYLFKEKRSFKPPWPLAKKSLPSSAKGYKANSKDLGLQSTTMKAIIHKWRKFGTVVNLPRSRWPAKISPRVHQQLFHEIAKEPRTTS